MTKASSFTALVFAAALVTLGVAGGVVFFLLSAKPEPANSGVAIAEPARENAPPPPPPANEPHRVDPRIVKVSKPTKDPEGAITLESRVARPDEAGEASSGSLERSVVARVVRQKLSRVRSCYEIGLRRDPGLSGTLTVEFVIDPTGRVEESTIASASLDDADVEACVLKIVDSMRFPAPEGGSLTVTYPFVLESQ